MSINIAVVSLWAEDVPKTALFYRDVIGLPLQHHGDRPHFKLGDTYFIILKGRPMPAQDSMPQRFPVVAFGVDDLDAALARLQAHQVALPWGIEKDASSRWVMFYDPAGNLIEIVQFG